MLFERMVELYSNYSNVWYVSGYVCATLYRVKIMVLVIFCITD